MSAATIPHCPDEDAPPIVWEHSDGTRTVRLEVDPTGRVTLAVETDDGPLDQQVVVLDWMAVLALNRATATVRWLLTQAVRP